MCIWTRAFVFHFRNEAGPTQAPQLRDPEVPREPNSPQLRITASAVMVFEST